MKVIYVKPINPSEAIEHRFVELVPLGSVFEVSGYPYAPKIYVPELNSNFDVYEYEIGTYFKVLPDESDAN